MMDTVLDRESSIGKLKKFEGHLTEIGWVKEPIIVRNFPVLFVEYEAWLSEFCEADGAKPEYEFRIVRDQMPVIGAFGFRTEANALLFRLQFSETIVSPTRFAAEALWIIAGKAFADQMVRDILGVQPMNAPSYAAVLKERYGSHDQPEASGQCESPGGTDDARPAQP